MRKAGILMHISSLPSPYGIGSYGQSAYDFVDFLHEAKQTYWQLLPLGPTSYGDSPYQTFSAFANNPYFIDLDVLIKEGLLLKSEAKTSGDHPLLVDYEKLYKERFKILKKAFHRFDDSDESYQHFLKEEAFWLEDYALFMAIKHAHDGKSWLYWAENIRLRDEDVIAHLKIQLQDEINFHKFMQYEANKQYQSLKLYANARGIGIIGDMPIYVSYDSSDVWAHPEMFDLDERHMPNEVAGVPPDNYSADGQLWGNPLYRWSYMKAHGYQWWIKRVQYSSRLFDMIRIDHFIGFVNYFAIKYGEKTAVNGTWKQGPSDDLFEAIKQAIKDVHIIAEDLGVVTPKVREALIKTGFPGMKLLQFAFDSRESSDYLPHFYDKNVIAYTGTHDNMTTASWFESLSKADLAYCLDYINHTSGHPVDSLIKTTLGCVADTAIIPIQDYLHLGSEGRMNMPSTVGGNWIWRVDKAKLTDELKEKIKRFTVLYGRSPDQVK